MKLNDNTTEINQDSTIIETIENSSNQEEINKKIPKLKKYYKLFIIVACIILFIILFVIIRFFRRKKLLQTGKIYSKELQNSNNISRDNNNVLEISSNSYNFK